LALELDAEVAFAAGEAMLTFLLDPDLREAMNFLQRSPEVADVD
jgi:hypothetical protein